MTDSLLTGLDQPLPAGIASDPEWRLLTQQVDRVLQVCDERGSINAMFKLANELIKGSALKALALSRLLYEGLQRAADYGITDEAYVELVFVRTGVSVRTLRGHIDIWQDLFAKGSAVPADIRPRLLERPNRSLKEVRRIIDHKGGKVGKRLWNRIVGAEDHRAIVAISKEVRSVIPKTGGMQITLDRETGTITAWVDGLQPEVLGFLRCNKTDLKSPLRKRGFDLIMGAAGILEQQ